MAEAKQNSEWSQTSLVCSILANSHFDTKGKPFRPEDFNPFATKKSNVVIEDKAMFMEALKAAFVKDKAK